MQGTLPFLFTLTLTAVTRRPWGQIKRLCLLSLDLLLGRCVWCQVRGLGSHGGPSPFRDTQHTTLGIERLALEEDVDNVQGGII